MKFFFLLFKIFRLLGVNLRKCGKLSKRKLKTQNLCKILGIFYKRHFLFRFVLVQLWNISKLPYKINYQGHNFTLFHVQPYTLELSIRHFQTPKDQGYLKLTQKFEKIDIAQPPKCPFFNPKNPLCPPLFLWAILLNKTYSYGHPKWLKSHFMKQNWGTLNQN